MEAIPSFSVGGLSRFLALRTLKCSGIKLPNQIHHRQIDHKTVLGSKGALTPYTLIDFSRFFQANITVQPFIFLFLVKPNIDPMENLSGINLTVLS